jgi:hypothetical protein
MRILGFMSGTSHDGLMSGTSHDGIDGAPPAAGHQPPRSLRPR